MHAGSLRKRVIIQSRSVSQDTFGQQVVLWSDVLAGDVLGSPLTVSGATVGAVTTIHSTAHGLASGAHVTLAGITGAAGLAATFVIQNVTADTFDVPFVTTGLTLGAVAATATHVSGVHAGILPLYAYEKMAQGQASEVHQVSLRWHPALSNPVEVAAMRVVYGSRILEINGSLNDEERNREITLNCTEGLTQG